MILAFEDCAWSKQGGEVGGVERVLGRPQDLAAAGLDDEPVTSRSSDWPKA